MTALPCRVTERAVYAYCASSCGSPPTGMASSDSSGLSASAGSVSFGASGTSRRFGASRGFGCIRRFRRFRSRRVSCFGRFLAPNFLIVHFFQLMAQFRALFRRQLRDVNLAALHQPVAELLKPTLDVVRRVLTVPDSLLPFFHQRARQIAALFPPETLPRRFRRT